MPPAPVDVEAEGRATPDFVATLGSFCRDKAIADAKTQRPEPHLLQGEDALFLVTSCVRA